MLPMALSCAASVRVSNALGANLPHAARRSAHTAAGMTAITQASLAAALVLGRNHWAGVFTNLEEVRGGQGMRVSVRRGVSACMAGIS